MAGRRLGDGQTSTRTSTFNGCHHAQQRDSPPPLMAQSRPCLISPLYENITLAEAELWCSCSVEGLQTFIETKFTAANICHEEMGDGFRTSENRPNSKVNFDFPPFVGRWILKSDTVDANFRVTTSESSRAKLNEILYFKRQIEESVCMAILGNFGSRGLHGHSNRPWD